MLRLPRLEAVLGAPIAELVAEHLERAVAEQIAEDSDLDWKQGLYGSSDKDKQELGKDVAALANGAGGLLVLGIAQDQQARATKPMPVALSDAAVRHMHQVLAELVRPVVPELEIRAVADPNLADHGYYLISVGPSRQRPHCVRRRDNLGYPSRYGSTTRWLSETEVAEAYRGRFQAAEQQIDRLARVHANGLQRVSTVEEAWLTLALVPDYAGASRLGPDAVETCRQFLEQWTEDGPPTSATTTNAPSIYVGRRRMLVDDRAAVGVPDRVCHFQLHLDGSGFAAVRLARTESDSVPAQHADNVGLEADQCEMEPLALLWLLSRWAVARGATGDAAVSCRLEPVQVSRPDFTRALELQVDLAQRGPMTFSGSNVRSRLLGTYASRLLTPAEVTIALAAVATDPHELLAAGRSIASDLLSEFGLPQPRLLGESINWDEAFVSRQVILRQWAQRFGLAS